MATDVASRYDEVVDYLAAQGGSVHANQGRSPTRAMAEALGWSLAQLNAALSELEVEGRVEREVRNRRTYRVGLTTRPVAPAEVETPSAVTPPTTADAPAKKGRLGRLRRGSDAVSPAISDDGTTSAEAAAAAEMAAVAAPPSWSPSTPTEVTPDAKSTKNKKRRKDKEPKAEKPAKAPKAPKAEKAPKPEKAKKAKAEKAKPVPAVRSSTGYAYEIRDMPNRWLEPMGETVLARYPTSPAAFDELRRLNRKGGPFVPRVVVRIAADGTAEIAIPGE